MPPTPTARSRRGYPPFHSHGPRSCGDHRHDATNITSNFPTYLKRHRRVASTDWLIACSTCHRRAGLSEMHDLPCGHMLCRDCVVAAARLVKRSIERNIKQIEDARKKLVEIDAALQGESGVEAREKKMLIRRHAQLQKNVMKLAGLTCCGMNSRLDQFLGCLRPEMSRELWLQIQWVCDSPKAKRG
ncbi:hypothetical protein N0V88_004952 [Collariella sp. IMI 366227]|nr:hypothetical protein N0V88_004952 [Collariella sp. IMI 366227]